MKFFPKELWSNLDPKRQNPAWETLGPLLPDPPGVNTAVKGKRKAEAMTTQNMRGKRRHVGIDSDDEEDDTAFAPGHRKKPQKREKDLLPDAGQRKGLEAEDDYGPDAEQANDEDQDGEEEVVDDSAFEESDDGAGDDYNAENYFDAGDEDDFDDGGAEDDGGTFLS